MLISLMGLQRLFLPLSIPAALQQARAQEAPTHPAAFAEALFD